MVELSHVIFVAQGSIPGQTRMNNEALYYVYREVWEGRALLDTATHGGYVTKEEADARAKEVRKEYES